MATLFLALQCVQCSTMQVKQQKKSSNKWVCVVCNQRQSVLRVHARGYRAADLRRFVQEANLSRGRGAAVPQAEWGPSAAEEQRDESPVKKRRMDWSEYLTDSREHDGARGDDAGVRDGGIEVTTELPDERPKVPLLKRPPKAQLGVGAKKFKPPFNTSLSKMQQIEQVSTRSTHCSATSTAEAQRSKWSKYLDSSFFEDRSGTEGSGLHWTELDEGATTEVVVDDEVQFSGCLGSLGYHGEIPGEVGQVCALWEEINKSNSIKAKDLPKTANGKGYTTGSSPMISEPVLVSSCNGTVPTVGEAVNSNLPNGEAMQNTVQVVENQNIVGSDTPITPEKLREELAAVKAQAALRGYLARRAFHALKGIIRLQALIRGHLVRRQAVSALRATWLIVKFQALVRGRNSRISSAASQLAVKLDQHKFEGPKSSDAWKEKVSSNAYVRKLLYLPCVVEPLQFQYDDRDPNSSKNWLERWTISCIWKPVTQPKKVTDGKPLVRRASYAMETESARLKRNARKCSTATVENFQTNTSTEPEKTKRNPRKFSCSPADSIPDSQLSELEKVKRNLRKATNSMAEASKISISKADVLKIPNSMTDISKVPNSTAEPSETPSLVNGISDHQDNHCGEVLQSAREPFSPPETQESHRVNLLENSNMDKWVLDLTDSGENVNEPTTVAQPVEVMPPQNIDNEDSVLGNKEEIWSKEERLSNGSLKTSKRRSSFSNGTQNTPVQPRQPSYMAATESLKAKLRPPRLDSDSPVDKTGFTRRQSLPSAANNRAIKVDWRR